MGEPTYTVIWRRPDDSAAEICTGLTMRKMLARLKKAIRANGYIVVHEVRREY